MIEPAQLVWLSYKFPKWSSLQSRDSYQCRHFCYRVRTIIVLLYLGYEQIGDNRHPEVRTDSILRVSPHGLNNDVLFDPFEEYLNIPPVPVQVSDLQCTDVEVVGDEYDFVFIILVIVAYGSYRFRVQRHCIRLRQPYGEVACNSSLPDEEHPCRCPANDQADDV